MKTLQVFCSTDLHGALASDSHLLNEPEIDAALLNLCTAFEVCQQQGYESLWLDNGDSSSGSLLTRLAQERGRTPPILEFLRDHLNLAAIGLGNHEFDQGVVALQRLLAESRLPWICANVRCTQGPLLPASRLLRSAQGLRIAVIASLDEACTAHIPAPDLAPYRIAPAVAAVKQEVARLQAEGGFDRLVVLHHGGLKQALPHPFGPPYPEPPMIIHPLLQAGLPIDLLVLGHKHGLLAPRLVPNGQHQTLVTQPGCHASHMARIWGWEEEGPLDGELLKSARFPTAMHQSTRLISTWGEIFCWLDTPLQVKEQQWELLWDRWQALIPAAQLLLLPEPAVKLLENLPGKRREVVEAVADDYLQVHALLPEQLKALCDSHGLKILALQDAPELVDGRITLALPGSFAKKSLALDAKAIAHSAKTLRAAALDLLLEAHT